MGEPAQTETDTLRERIHYLEGMLGIRDEALLAKLYDLTAAESRVLGLLVRRGFVPGATVKDGVALDFSGRGDGNVYYALVSRLRRKMAARGVPLTCRYGQGYEIAEPALGRVRAALGTMREAFRIAGEGVGP